MLIASDNSNAIQINYIMKKKVTEKYLPYKKEQEYTYRFPSTISDVSKYIQELNIHSNKEIDQSKISSPKILSHRVAITNKKSTKLYEGSNELCKDINEDTSFKKFPLHSYECGKKCKDDSKKMPTKNKVVYRKNLNEGKELQDRKSELPKANKVSMEDSLRRTIITKQYFALIS